MPARTLRNGKASIDGEEEGVSEEGIWLLPFLTPLYVLSALLAAFAAYVLYQVQHGPFQLVLWRQPPPLMALPVNHNLAGAEHLFLNQVVGPESIAVGAHDELYLSLNDGRVVRTDSHYAHMTTVFFTGGVIKAEQGKGYPTGILPNGTHETALMAWCSAEMQAMRFSTPTETQCGRPLGMRYVAESNLLYIADAYHGIFTLDATTLHVRHLVAPDAPLAMPEAGMVHAGIRKPLRFSNDLDIVPGSGDIVFTDSTWAWSRAEHAVDITDGAPRGRLFRYVAATQELQPIICGLHFANGVQFLGDVKNGLPHYTLVVESTRFRILKVDLWAWAAASPGVKQAALRGCEEDAPYPPFVSVFIEGLPGLPDNIRLHPGDVKGLGKDVLLFGMGAKNAQPFALLQFLYQHLLLRHLVGALVPLSLFHTFMPKYGLAGVLSQDGELLRVLQDPTGRTPCLSEVHVHPTTGDLLLGSFRNRFLAKVTLSALQ